MTREDYFNNMLGHYYHGQALENAVKRAIDNQDRDYALLRSTNEPGIDGLIASIYRSNFFRTGCITEPPCDIKNENTCVLSVPPSTRLNSVPFSFTIGSSFINRLVFPINSSKTRKNSLSIKKVSESLWIIGDNQFIC